MVKSYQLLMVRDSNFKGNTVTVKSPEDIADLLNEYLKGKDRECFVLVALSTRNKVIGIHTVSSGTLDSTIVHPREVFKFAILANAGQIIIGHNHPSGEVEPSGDDIRMTRRLKEAGEILGISLVDHLIVDGEGTSYSLARHNQL